MPKQNTPTFADDMRAMLAAWSKIETAARAQFPHASADEIEQITRGAFSHVLGLKG